MTDSLKYTLSALVLLTGIYIYNQNVQQSHIVSDSSIFSGNPEDIHRVLITEAENSLELVRSDTTWRISQADTLLIKENQIKNLFDRLLTVKMEMLISRNETKWEKFGVDDSLGRHLQVFDDEDKKLIHYIFGNAGQDYQHNYIRDSNSSEVYRTNDNVYFLLNSSATYWGKSPPKPEKLETDL
ncbi:MAG: DUF4340 domain-containing protein [Candidatus Marinimicrobia bacterium]|nr:DUF4340 domain-containing protein [Candidatus Neomarinimicrobiota bacterium]